MAVAAKERKRGRTELAGGRHKLTRLGLVDASKLPAGEFVMVNLPSDRGDYEAVAVIQAAFGFSSAAEAVRYAIIQTGVKIAAGKAGKSKAGGAVGDLPKSRHMMLRMRRRELEALKGIADALECGSRAEAIRACIHREAVACGMPAGK